MIVMIVVIFLNSIQIVLYHLDMQYYLNIFANYVIPLFAIIEHILTIITIAIMYKDNIRGNINNEHINVDINNANNERDASEDNKLKDEGKFDDFKDKF